jgi:FkbM family methyltransferase
VFVDEVYAIDGAGDPATILDLGGHIGLSALWFHAKFPSARIFALEPDPSSFRLMERNTRGVERIVARNLAVGASRRTAPFFPAAQTWLSSLLPEDETHGGGAVEVHVEPLPEVLAELGLDRVGLLKLDVEGAEWEILASTSLDAIADVVVGELHARGAPDGKPDSGLPLLGSFELEVRQNDAHCCVFVARR